MLPLSLCTDIARKYVPQIVLFSRQQCLCVFPATDKAHCLLHLRPDPVKDLFCFWAGAGFRCTDMSWCLCHTRVLVAQ